ncbi:uncharacterized protein LOC132945627 [Metopolophium dirhodum]|uniref:uncharacterized protein LOC132945627 n=1 Tax=Metopolophium dirhodum TaxID=44670 RepID=UPI00299036C5|nr:uncharacterized protein LOC132945627 [Metopolophium dirhodum]
MDRFVTKKIRLDLATGAQEENADDPHLDKSNQAPLEPPSFKYLFNDFYKVLTVEGKKLSVICQNCQKVVNGSTNSSGNFLSHIKLKHNSLMQKVNQARKRHDVSKTTEIQTKLFSGPTKKWSKDKIGNLVFNYIIQEMRPLITCEKPAFRQLIFGLTGLTSADSVLLPDRNYISKKLNSSYTNYISMLTSLLNKQQYICTTADIWSTNNKSYLGMTCHFIEEISYTRHSYVLGCRRIKGGHNYLNISELINEITQTYQISTSKITHTITDNASNFGKAFRTFSTTLCEKSNTYDVGNLSSDSDSNTIGENSESEDDEGCEIQYVDLYPLLSEESNEHSEDISICLPDHMNCCAHTLNLIATTDIAKITDRSYLQISKATFEKLFKFWNLVSRSTAASDTVSDKCNCKFPVPVITRWNSMYDAAKKILYYKEKLIPVFDELKLNKLKMTEWLFLNEYCEVMEPLASALDKLQGEKRSYLGYVAPTILSIRLLLLKSTNRVYCKPLSLCIIQNLEKRFDYLFNLNSSKSKAFIIASISHPKFKMNWVPIRYKNLCRNLFVSECNTLSAVISSTPNSGSSSEENNESDDDNFYNNLLENCIDENLNESQCTTEKRNTNLAGIQSSSFLNSKNKNLIMLDSFFIVKNVFLKYNTSLPSSAPVERLFSGAIQVLTPRRNRLKDTTFEKLLCCRCNL